MNELLQKKLALRAKNGKKGFTLVEVLVVLVIIAILAAIAIPALTGYIAKAEQRSSVTQAAVVRTSLQSIASDSYTTANASGTDPITGITDGSKTVYDTSSGTTGPDLPGYSPVAPPNNDKVTVGDEIRALTGMSIPAADGDLQNITWSGRTLTGFEIKIGQYTVTYASGNYTVTSP
jgi:prepilin-type N-terminal cleavage/methylation domain-containing protein